MIAHRPPIRLVYMGFLAVLIVVPFAPAGSDQPSPKVAASPSQKGESPPVARLDELLPFVHQLEEKRRQTGEAILARLKANDFGSHQWEEAVLALGYLRYEPAAGFLVEHITKPRWNTGPRNLGRERRPALNVPGSWFGWNTLRPRAPTKLEQESVAFETTYPAIRALWLIGHPAVDPLIKVYLPRKIGAKKDAKGDTSTVLQNIEYTLGHPTLYGAALARLDELEKAKKVIDPNDPELTAIKALRDVLRKPWWRPLSASVPQIADE